MAIIENIDLTPDQRREVCAVLKKFFPDIEIWAYGSRVKWNARPNSDLDLVAFLPDEQKEKLFACREAFEESSLPFKVDLFSWDDIPENFQKQIKENYAVIQTAGKKIEWKKVKLSDVVSILGDGIHGTPNYDTNGEYFFINGNNLLDGHIVFKEDTKRVSYAEYMKHKKELTDRTILVSINGTIGNIALYRGEKCILGKSACYFNIRPEVDRDFIYYALNHENFQNYAVTLATGSTIKNVSLKQMREYEFLLPPLSEQKRIAGILSAFDDKIELNRKMCKTLEAMAQALFKSWFVDFEPVKAKIAAIDAGLDPELAAMMTISGKTESDLVEMRSSHPEAYTELANTASLFPSAIVKDPELGQIPVWKVYQFKDILIEEKEKCGERDIPEFSVTDTGIHPRDNKFKKLLSASKCKNKVLRKNQLVFGMSREILNWGIMEEEIGGVSSVYNIFSVFPEINIEYLKMFIANKAIYFRDLIKPAAREGQSIDKKVLMQKRISYPDEQLLQCWIEKHMSLQEKQKGIFAMQNILTTQQALSLSTLISASNSTERNVTR